MPYITLDYYKTTYLGIDPQDDTALSRAIARASDDIDMHTGFGIALADLDEAQLDQVQRATAAQAEFYVQNGDTYNEAAAGGSERIGSYSTSGAAARSSGGGLSSRAVRYLEQSGLMYRGARILDLAGGLADCDE